MSHFNASAPIRLHGPAKRVTQKEAHRLIADYLARSATAPELHPDCKLEGDGPLFNTPGAEGVVMTQLRRLEAGLRGEHLAAEIEDGFGVDGWNKGLGGNLEENYGKSVDILETDGVDAVTEEQDAGEGMWQDKAEFEQEQEDLEGDIGPRTTAYRQAQPGEDLVPHVQGVSGADSASKDRMRKKRKEEKKARKKEEQRAREKERKRVKKEGNSSDEDTA